MNRFYLGDWKLIANTIDDESIDAIITDPPFGVDFDNEVYNDSKKDVENNMLTWLKLMYKKLKNNSHCFIYCGVKNLNVWINNAIKAGFLYKNLLASKSYDSYNYAGGNNFKFNLQPIIYLSKGNPKKFNKVNFFYTSKDWFNDKRNKNPQKYTYSYSSFIDKEISFANVKTNNFLKHLHNSEKNIKLLKFFAEISTNENETILDPFMGSGTMCDVCKQLKRNFIGVEINEEIYNFVYKKYT